MDTRSTSGPPGAGDGSPPEEGGSSYLYLNQSRRGFLTGLATITVGATALVGGLVGFTPTAIAQGTNPQYPCCPGGGCFNGSIAYIAAGYCLRSCTGYCVSPGQTSCCNCCEPYAPDPCEGCGSECAPKFQVRVTCNPSDQSGYFCAIGC